MRYWSEATLCRFLELPDTLGVGPVVFQMASYLGAFPFSSQAPAILTYEALLKVVTILTERYGAVIKKRSHVIWRREIYRSLAIYDKGIRSEIEGKEKADTTSSGTEEWKSSSAGFAVDAVGGDDEDDDGDDDDGPVDGGYDKAPGDPNAYSTGVIGRHNVVLLMSSSTVNSQTSTTQSSPPTTSSSWSSCSSSLRR